MWTTLVSLIGVTLGGLMSLLAQHSLGRAAEKAEVRRSIRERAEARRNEGLRYCIDFMATVQKAERVAVDRYHHNVTDEYWQERSKQVIDKMWVAQKTIHILCAPEVNEAARAVAFAVQDVIREEPANPDAPQGEKIWAHIRPSRRAFLDAVRDYLK